MKEQEGFTGYYLEVKKEGSRYNLYDNEGRKISSSNIINPTRKKAAKLGKALGEYTTSTGKTMWRLVDQSMFDATVKTTDTQNANPVLEDDSEHTQLKSFIHDQSVRLKPENLILPDVSWKYLVRSAYRGKNIMMTGPAGCGKTFAAKSLVKALEREFFYFNLGASQDPRGMLIGNTHFDPSKGTYFDQSEFVKAIQTENSVILLDELTRANPEAWNILMTILDQGQRYLRLDEADGTPIVNVAKGVTFVATANMGNEYTSTRVIDRALKDRFAIIEMPLLKADEELGLLKYMFPQVDESILKSIAEIASATRVEWKSEEGKLSDMVSTRNSVEIAELIYDGFTLQEAAEVAVYPFFSDDGGAESERTYVKQIVQKYIVQDGLEPETQYEASEYKNVDDINF